MNKNRLLQYTCLVLLFLGVLTVIPIASASPQLVSENFEGQTVGNAPTCGAGCTYNEPTGTGGGGTIRISNTVAHTGSNSGLVHQNSGSGDEPEFIVGTTNFCSGNYEFSFWLYFSSLPGAANSYDFVIGDARYHINNDATLKVHQAALSDTTLSSSVPLATWIDFAVQIGNCANGIQGVKSTVLGIDTVIDFANSMVGADRITFAGRDSTGNGLPAAALTFFIDDFGTGAQIGPTVEPYEAYSAGATPTPTDYLYSESQATGVVSNSIAHQGTKSLLYTASGNVGEIRNDFTSDLCNQNYVQVWWNIPALPVGSSDVLILNNQAGTLSFPFALYIASNGNLIAYDGANPSQTVVTSFPTNQWVDIKITMTCPTRNVGITSTTLGVSTSYSFGTSANRVDRLVFATRGATPASNGGSGNTYSIDDMTYPGYGGGVFTGLTPVATSSTYTNIVGFDISKNGQFVTLRNNIATGNSLIDSLDGISLASQLAPIQTQCGRINGVVAEGDSGIAYIHCNSSGSHNPDQINFINPTGQSYPYNPPCVQAHYTCDGSIDISGVGISATDRDALSDMVAVIPGEFYGQSTANSGIITGFNIGMSESTGNIADANMGWSLTSSGATTTEHFHTTVATDLNNLQDEICSFGNLRMFRSESGVPVKGYTIALNNNPSSSGDQLPNPTLTQTFTGSQGALTTGQHIDCSNTRIIVASPTEVSVWDYSTNQLVFTLTGLSNVQYVTISGNGSYAAYEDNTNIHIISGTDGHELTYAPLTFTASNTVDMEMDNCAQSLYISSNLNAYRYNITGNTTGTPVTVSNGSCIVSSGISGTSSTSSSATSTGITIGGSSSTVTNPFHASDDNPFGLNITYISTQLHVSHEGVAVMIGLIFVVIFTIWLWRGTGSPIIALLGSGLGLMVATLFGFINVWVLMVVILFLIVMLGKMLFGGFTGGEES